MMAPISKFHNILWIAATLMFVPVISLAQDTSGNDTMAGGGAKITIIPGVIEAEISQDQVPLVVLAVILIGLSLYVPRGFVAVRDLFISLRSKRAYFESEKIKYEILKLIHEIEAIRKTHQLSELTLPIELEKRIKVSEPVSSTGYDPAAAISEQLKDDAVRRAYLWRRIFAFLIDYVVISIGVNIVFIGGSMMYIPIMEIMKIMYLVSLIAIILYFPLMWRFWGATVGKLALGLKIVRLDGSPLRLRDAIVRFVVWAVTSVLGLFWAGWDKQRRSLYDKAAGTTIVYVRTAKRGYHKE